MRRVPSSRTVPRGEESVPRLDRDSIKSACEAELRRLRTDYIDLFYLHWPDRYVPAFGTHRYRLDKGKLRLPHPQH
jgi:aryl-alcohol dehydrogenase-like predicted oxidoreductase